MMIVNEIAMMIAIAMQGMLLNVNTLGSNSSRLFGMAFIGVIIATITLSWMLVIVHVIKLIKNKIKEKKEIKADQ